PDRHAVRTKPQCLACHPNAKAAGSPIEQHAVHQDRVNCVVCHSTVYRGCENCHLGAGAKSSLQFKIGKTARADAPYQITLLRHVPTVRTMLDPKLKDGMPNYDAVPTWKDTTPQGRGRWHAGVGEGRVSGREIGTGNPVPFLGGPNAWVPPFFWTARSPFQPKGQLHACTSSAHREKSAPERGPDEETYVTIPLIAHAR
ncbi:MAG: hypothetical protein HY803_07980, partial [candidate division NC10 bacterium]|nr:hypothetical protein [candidate division NC10 bacterium]